MKREWTNPTTATATTTTTTPTAGIFISFLTGVRTV